MEGIKFVGRYVGIVDTCGKPYRVYSDYINSNVYSINLDIEGFKDKLVLVKEVSSSIEPLLMNLIRGDILAGKNVVDIDVLELKTKRGSVGG